MSKGSNQLWQKIRIWAGVLVTLSVSILAACLTQNVSVKADDATMAEKSRLYALTRCYSYDFISPIDLSPDDWGGVDSLVGGVSSIFVYNPAQKYETSNMYQTCHSLVSSFNVVPEWGSSSEQVTNFLTSIGYKDQGSTNSTNLPCGEIHLKNTNGNDSTISICNPTSNGTENGTIPSGSFQINQYGSTSGFRVLRDAGGKIVVKYKYGLSEKLVSYTPGKTTLKSVVEAIKARIEEFISEKGKTSNGITALDGWYTNGNPTYTSTGQMFRTFTKGTSTNQLLSRFSSYSNVTQLGLTNDEIGPYLVDWLVQHIKITYYNGESTACYNMNSDRKKDAEANGYRRVSLGTNLACYIKPASNATAPGYTRAGSDATHYFDGTTFDANLVMSELNRIYGLPEEVFPDDAKQKCNDAANAALSEINQLLKDSSLKDNDPEYYQKLTTAKAGIENIIRQHGEYWHMENGVVVCYELPDYSKPDIEADKQKCNDAANAKLKEIDDLLAKGGLSQAYENKLKNAKIGINNIITQHGEYWKMENGKIICYDLPDTSNPDGEKEDPGGTTTPPKREDDGVTDGGSDYTACLNQVGALGWILCPALSIIKASAESFYDNIITDWLPIEANLVNNTSGIYEGWKIFRNAANIVFIIMLMIILLSQISGVGVSNYGIKKMLPSLIVVAILVNISYLLCQLLVDVTNVVGAEIGQILSNIGSLGNNSDTAFAVTGGTVIKDAIGKIFTAAGIGVATSVALKYHGSLGVIVLVFGIGILISSFFFFAILAIRKAAVFVCIIIAPLAIICYALPNMKSLYDKWRKLFVATLLVYPICQIVTGGGQMVSKLMLGQGQDGFIYNIVAIILSFAPIFLIPSIVSSSLAGLGNVGAKVSQVGRRLNGVATRRAENSDIAKRIRVAGNARGAMNARSLNERLRNMRGVGRVVRGFQDGTAVGRALSANSTRNAAKAAQAYRKLRLEEGEAGFIADNMNIDRDLAAQQYRQQQDLISNAEQTFRQDGISYNGTTVSANDTDGAMDALEYYASEFDRDTNNAEALTNMQALTSILMESGDTGRSAVMNQLKAHNFDASGNDRGTASFSRLTDYIHRNQKWMGGLKVADRGSFNMVGDGAKRAALANVHKYNTAGAQNIVANGEAIHQLGDSFYDGIEAAYKAGIYSVPNSAERSELENVYEAFRTAMSNPVTAKGLNIKDINNMNRVVAVLNDNNVSGGKQYSKFQLGQTLKVPKQKKQKNQP